ncbi:MAG: hypothetical protein LBJ62_05000 [Bifidobacteriaceae bacterium]|nr:hypothetical protein [Bifidobacteriaceae bacterium]
MPTSLPRHAITETPEIAAAIDSGHAEWPSVSSRAEIVRRLILEGSGAIRRRHHGRKASHAKAVEQWAGSTPGVFPPDAVTALHGEWPE